jgi:hypothetical protein
MPGVCGGGDARVEGVSVGGEEVDLGLKAKKFPQEDDCGIEKDVRYNTAVNEKERTKSRKKHA